MKKANELIKLVKGFEGRPANDFTAGLKKIGNGKSMVNGVTNMLANLGRECDRLLKNTRISYGTGGLIAGGLIVASVSRHINEQEKKEIEIEHQRQLQILQDQLAESKTKEMSQSKDNLVNSDSIEAYTKEEKDDYF